ncbi:MAG: TIGR03013 family PEP-CTERM/XrtA system glycosyltransferase [Gammaproteobacteria bacterium]
MPHTFLLLGVFEAAILIFSIYVGASLRVGVEGGTLGDMQPLMPKALLFAFVMVCVMTAVGLYKANLRDGMVGMLLRIGISILLGVGVMSLVFYIFPSLFLGRGAFGLSFAVALMGIILARITFFKIVDQDALQRRILVLGSGKRAGQISRQLRRKVDRRGFAILGYVHIPGEHSVIDAQHMLHLDVPLLEYCDQHQIDEIVVAVEDRRKGFPVHELLDCKMSGIEVADMLTFFERQTGKIRLDLLHPSWLIFSDGFLTNSVREFNKRVFDVMASVLILALTWPIMILTIIAILMESRGCGPVLYRQVRVGQNWELIEVLKFRSMCVDAEKDGPQWAGKNDSRITRVGAFIRKTRIDELPQLLGVLKGDMSFVGPRPERPVFVEQLSQSIPYYAERHRVKPGITGWAQIRYAYGSSEEDAVEKLQYDLYYVKNHSLFLDLMILFQTVEVILWGRGAR